MRRRYRLQNRTEFVEAPYCNTGLRFLILCQDWLPKFRFFEIKDVIQAYPSKIRVGVIYKLEG